jgi:NADPH2:quinone reductase
MKAVLCKQYGPPETLVVEDIEPPVAGDGQVVMDVHAAAVNFPDVLVIENKYQFKPPLPFSPGGEVAGVVTAIGDGVKGFAPGDRVMGLCGMGGFREQLALPAAACVMMPDALDFHNGAAMNLTYGTSFHGLKDRANLQPGETLFVMGASGGVGLGAVVLGKALGAKVIAGGVP